MKRQTSKEEEDQEGEVKRGVREEGASDSRKNHERSGGGEADSKEGRC